VILASPKVRKGRKRVHIAYADQDPKTLTLRDYLALDRTVLANQRTILAYIRTGLMMLASGVTLIKFFPDDLAMVVTGYVFFFLGALVLIFGVNRYFRTRKALRAVPHPPEWITEE